MSDTTCHMSISLDGFVAGPEQSRANPLGKRGRELHGWHSGDPRATEADKTATGWLMRPRGAARCPHSALAPAAHPTQMAIPTRFSSATGSRP